MAIDSNNNTKICNDSTIQPTIQGAGNEGFCFIIEPLVRQVKYTDLPQNQVFTVGVPGHATIGHLARFLETKFGFPMTANSDGRHYTQPFGIFVQFSTGEYAPIISGERLNRMMVNFPNCYDATHKYGRLYYSYKLEIPQPQPEPEPKVSAQTVE